VTTVGPTDLEFGDTRPEPADDVELDTLRQARVDAALQAGWAIRHDPLRGEFTAARELQVGRTLDELLGKIEAAR
jgi:hypothetical protein